MRSSIRFIMHPEDEALSQEHIFAEEDIVVFDECGWPTSTPPLKQDPKNPKQIFEAFRVKPYSPKAA